MILHIGIIGILFRTLISKLLGRALAMRRVATSRADGVELDGHSKVSSHVGIRSNESTADDASVVARGSHQVLPES